MYPGRGDPEPRPKFSILTPSYKRGTLLPYVWLSLINQSYCDFEWLVGIDGVNDDSLEIIEGLASFCDFSIRVIASDLHVGKSVIDNRLISESKGEWILWCDSDDYLSPCCLETLSKSLNNVGEKDWYCIIASISKNMETLNKERPDSIPLRVGTVRSLAASCFESDGLMCVNANILKSERFPEVDFYCPEGILWNRHLDDKAIFVDLALMVRYFLSDGISSMRKIHYPRGKFHVWAFEMSQAVNRKDINVWSFVLCASQTARFGYHSVSIKELLSSYSYRFSWFNSIGYVGLIIGFSVYILDKLFRRIEYTHVEFDNNITRYKISSTQYNCL
jgi:glycosyltransferase involved in cell wall biosynthesis